MIETRSEGKAFDISKHLVWAAYQKVKANKGAAGIDGQSLADFAQDEKDNLYKIWNRMSSGSYSRRRSRRWRSRRQAGRAAGVRRANGRGQDSSNGGDHGARTGGGTGVPPRFVWLPPGRSALDAVATCRQRCWEQSWVIDLDIQGFFDNVPHEPILQAVAHHTDLPWVLVYVRRWLTAPIQQPDGTLASGIAEPHKGRRFHPCCRTCSCTTRSIVG